MILTATTNDNDSWSRHLEMEELGKDALMRCVERES